MVSQRRNLSCTILLFRTRHDDVCHTEGHSDIVCCVWGKELGTGMGTAVFGRERISLFYTEMFLKYFMEKKSKTFILLNNFIQLVFRPKFVMIFLLITIKKPSTVMENLLEGHFKKMCL